ncbi:hypothetical protein KM043_011531 [Ampulex compressa]|nr:hypothetical protein KM043_011531 [Ampulex compressa]
MPWQGKSKKQTNSRPPPPFHNPTVSRRRSKRGSQRITHEDSTNCAPKCPGELPKLCKFHDHASSRFVVRQNQFNSRTNLCRLPRLIPDPQGSSRWGCKPENVAAKPGPPPPPAPPSWMPSFAGPRRCLPPSLSRRRAYPDDTRSIP